MGDEAGGWRYRAGNAEAMRLALRTGDSAMLNGLMTATPFTGARGSTADGDLVVAETALAP